MSTPEQRLIDSTILELRIMPSERQAMTTLFAERRVDQIQDRLTDSLLHDRVIEIPRLALTFGCPERIVLGLTKETILVIELARRGRLPGYGMGEAGAERWIRLALTPGLLTLPEEA